MGSGSWTTRSFTDYASRKGINVTCSLNGLSFSDNYNNQDLFTSKTIVNELNPKNIIRECCDTEEHPETLPIILALDVTGSMGQAAVEVAKNLNIIMTKLYSEVKDVEFMIMGIGDLAYDQYPVQASQFESDIRILEQLDKVFFEFGGGGNGFESYTAAWYFGARHTKLDCWNRGKKGVIITIGDEMLNPHLPKTGRYTSMEDVFGDAIQDNVETSDLYTEVSEKYNVYHLDINHRYRSNEDWIKSSFYKYLDKDHFKTITLDEISDEIICIIKNEANNTNSNSTVQVNVNTANGSGEIVW